MGFAIIVKVYIIIARIMPTLEFLGKKMENSQKYFQDIAEEVRHKRLFSGFSEHEQVVYLEGKKTALREVLIHFGTKQTCAALKARCTHLIKFLEREERGNKILTKETDTDIWDSNLSFTATELMDFVCVQISDLQARLEKAREIHKVQTTLIQNLSQMTID